MAHLKVVNFDPEEMEQAVPYLPWEELPGLHHVFRSSWRIKDEDITPALDQLARAFVRDALRYGLDNDFIRNMEEAAENDWLSTGQVRGILNVLGGRIKGHQKRFKYSRNNRIDARGWHTYDCCIVCGSILGDTRESVFRGCNPTCWRRVCGDWTW